MRSSTIICTTIYRYQNFFNAFSFEKVAPKEKALQKENAVFALTTETPTAHIYSLRGTPTPRGGKPRLFLSDLHQPFASQNRKVKKWTKQSHKASANIVLNRSTNQNLNPPTDFLQDCRI